MATLTPSNPILVQGGPLKRIRQAPATVSQTWKAGELCVYTTGLATLVASDGQVVHGQFLNDQTASTTASQLVWVGDIDADMIFEMYELDGTLAAANLQIPYALDVTSNVATVDVGDTGNDAVKIVEIAANYEPSRNVAADVKARCRVRFLAAVVDG